MGTFFDWILSSVGFDAPAVGAQLNIEFTN